MRVLIADDDETVLRSTEALLRTEGFEVVTESVPRRILERVVATRPDVVLQDLRMPGLDLHGLLASIADMPEGPPVVLFSASLELADVAHNLGVTAYVEKPFTTRVLVETLRYARRA